jgi:hypothetical protein
MPIVGVKRDLLFEALGRSYSTYKGLLAWLICSACAAQEQQPACQHQQMSQMAGLDQCCVQYPSAD